MRVWRDLTEVPDDLGRTVVTVGNFDGLHRGHQHVVQRARAAAATADVDTVVAVTFDPHPMAVLRPDHAPSMLTTISQRADLLAEAGVDDVLAIGFTREIAAWSPEEFIQRILVDALHATVVVVGANFRFGHRASGDVATLAAAGETHDFTVDAVALDGGPQVWSSTYIRTCLAEGDVSGAAEALGREFAVTGTVVQGDQRGRGLGYPTANVPVEAGCAVPADGVYAGWLRRADASESLPAAISVGTNPTFAGERARSVEAHVLDREDLDLYGRTVQIGFVERIRGMTRFDSVAQLCEAMAEDVARTRELLG